MPQQLDQSENDALETLLEDNGLSEQPNVVNLEQQTETVDPKAEAKAKKEAEKAEKAAAKEKAKAEKAAKAEAEKAAKEKAKAEKAEKPVAVKAEKIKQNGITQPLADSLCGKIWEVCNNLSANKNDVVTRKELLEYNKTLPESEQFNPITIGVQFGKWKTFYGLTASKKD